MDALQVLQMLREGVKEIRANLYEHGLHGPHASSYVEAQRAHAEPVLDDVEDLLNELMAEATNPQCREMSVGVGSRAPYSTMPVLRGDAWTNPRFGNRYT